MADGLSPQDLDKIPRLGWIQKPSPILSLPRIASLLHLEFLGFKQDSLCEQLYGGTKVRKLDYLLASPPFSDADTWVATGGIGSGNVVALTAAAQQLSRQVHAHLFWTPLSHGVLDNLAFTASGPTKITFHRSKVSFALRAPSLLLATGQGKIPIVPVGATSGLGMIGLVRAGLELGEQVRKGDVPEPERIYVPFGSGGIAVGLSMGLAMARLKSTVVAVAVVERFLATRVRILMLQRALAATLTSAGIKLPDRPAPIKLVHSYSGEGYAIASPASLAACELFASAGVELEPIYGGKAMAALMATAHKGRPGPVLFWQTARRGPLPHAEDWQKHLPEALLQRLAPPHKRPISRRRLLVAAGATIAAVTVGLRLTGYSPIEGYQGVVLSLWEAHVVRAATEALLPPNELHLWQDALAEVAMRVDRYLVPMPKAMLQEVHGMLTLIEHGTTVLGGRLSRFTDLTVAEREAYLMALMARGGILAQAYQGLRDLCMLGLYQQPATWKALGYEGPWVPLSYDPHGNERMQWPAYDDLVAPDGTLPKGILP